MFGCLSVFLSFCLSVFNVEFIFNQFPSNLKKEQKRRLFNDDDDTENLHRVQEEIA